MNRRIIIQGLRRDLHLLKEKVAHFEGVLDFYLKQQDDDEENGALKRTISARAGAYRILRQAGKPLHKNTIYESLRGMGIEVGGQNPSHNISAHLSLDPRIKSVGDGHWALVEWDDARHKLSRLPKIAETKLENVEEEAGTENLPF